MLTGKFGIRMFLVASLACTISCKKEDDAATVPAAEEDVKSEALILSVAAENLASVGSDDSGLLLGGPSTVGLTMLASDFDVETNCKDSGTVSDDFNSSESGWPLYTAYCNIVKRPDGPDTIRGALDRASGWL